MPRVPNGSESDPDEDVGKISTFARMYEPPTVAEEHSAFISYAKLPTVLKGVIMVVHG